MERAMAKQSSPGDRRIDRRTELQVGAALAIAGPALLRRTPAAAQPHPRGASPRPIIDSQVHAYAANTPQRPWSRVPNWPAHVTGDEMVAAMDRVGVDGAIAVSPFSMYRYDASYAVEVQQAHPDRFALVKPVDPDDPAVAEVIADWKKTPGTVGIRIIMTQEANRAPADPGLDRICRAAAGQDFPHSTGLCGEACPHSSEASRGEDLDIEEPVSGWDYSTLHFHSTLPGMLGSSLIGDQVIEVRQPCQKRLLAAPRMMEAFHGEQFPLDGVMGLIEQGARGGHLRVGEHRIPARLLVLKPASHALAVGRPSRRGDVVDKVTQPLAKRKYPQAFALACAVQQGVELCAQGLAHGRRDGDEFLRELQERVPQAEAETCSRKERSHTLRGTVKAIDEHPSDPIRRLLLRGCALKHPIGLGQSCRTRVLGIAQMPEHSTADNRGQIDLVR